MRKIVQTVNCHDISLETEIELAQQAAPLLICHVHRVYSV